MMRRHGADPHDAVALRDPAESRHARQIDDFARRGQPQLHQRNQAHAAGEDLPVAAFDQRQRFLQRRGRGVFEFLRDHARPPCWISFQIFCGVSGMSMCRTPNGESASTTEFTTAGEHPIVPASPTPFTPSGFTGDGVSVWLLSIHGMYDAPAESRSR